MLHSDPILGVCLLFLRVNSSSETTGQLLIGTSLKDMKVKTQLR